MERHLGQSCMESAKGETETLKMKGSLADDAMVGDGNRGKLRKTLK